MTRARRVYLAVSGKISGGILDSIALEKAATNGGGREGGSKKERKQASSLGYAELFGV